MASSTGRPAGTIISTRRGSCSIAISAAGDSAPATCFPFPGPSRNALVWAGETS